MLLTIPDVLKPAELEEIRALVAGAEFVDGRRSAGFRAKRVKRNEQVRKTPALASKLDPLIVGAIARNPVVKSAVMPRQIHAPMIARYAPGMTYGEHVDDAVMYGQAPLRTDASVTVFLNDPADYDGGELVIATPFGERSVKLAKGHAVVYDASSLHRVNPVTRGERLVAISWIQSLVREAARRQMLFDLAVVRQHLAKQDPDGKETQLLDRTLANLLREWAEV